MIVSVGCFTGWRLNAEDLDLEATEVGVVIFADAVSDVDHAALCEAKGRDKLGQAPANGADGMAGRNIGRWAGSLR